MARSWACAFVALSILAVPASLSAAAEPAPKKFTLSGRGYPAPVTVAIATPPGYTNGFGGAWTGPRWKNPSAEGNAGISVNVGGDPSARSAERAARNKLGSYVASWTVVASGPIAVPHVVRGRKVGSIQSFFLILHNPDKGYEGWYKAAIGVPLGKGYEILAADFLTTTPSDDASTTIEGKPPSVWNRQAIEQALRGVAVETQASPTSARCFGKRATVSGTTGTDGDDVIIGRSGNDTLRGLGGNDAICGGEGNDTIVAGAGDDRLSGGDGDDRLEGGQGADELWGDDGDDRLEGGEGDDRLIGGAGDDRLYGNGGNDRLVGGPGNDFLAGGAGNDELDAGGGNDTLKGGKGNDSLRGNTGSDTLNGGGSRDYLYGGEGWDRLNGGGGSDLLYGEGGNDRLRGGPGTDYVYGGPGADSCGEPPSASNECEYAA